MSLVDHGSGVLGQTDKGWYLNVEGGLLTLTKRLANLICV